MSVNRRGTRIVLIWVLTCFLAGSTINAVAQNRKKVKQAFNGQPDVAIKKLKDGDVKLRASFVPRIVRVYLGDRWALGIRAGKLLRKTGQQKPDKVVPVLIKRLKQARSDGTRSTRLRLIRLLGKIGPEAGTAVDVLIDELNSGEEAIIRAVLDALKQMGPSASDAVSHISPFMEHSSSVVRRNAFAAIISCGKGTNKIKALGPALLSTDLHLKRSSLEVLQSTDQSLDSVVDPLLQLVKDKGEEMAVRKQAAQLLKRGGEAASKRVDQLVNIGRDVPASLRSSIQEVLNSVKTKNQPPEPESITRRCREGQSIELRFSASDPDDLDIGHRAVIEKKPEHASLRRLGKRTFQFHTEPGYTETVTFQWRMADPRDKSKPVKTTVHIKPDTAPPILRSARIIDGNRIRIHAQEPLDSKSAEKAGQYRINNHTVKKPQLLQKGYVVQLKATSQDGDGIQAEHVRVSNLKDRSKAGNQMDRAVKLNVSRETASEDQLLLLGRASGTIRDASPHERELNATAGAGVDNRRGKGGAYEFTGRTGNKNNAVNVGQIEALQTAKTFTVGFWFRRRQDRDADSNHGTSNIMFSQGSDGANDNIEIGTDGSNVEVMLDTESGGVYSPWNGHIQNNTWYHLTLTFDSSRNREAWLYINGENVKKWSADGPLRKAASPVTLGNTFHIEAPFSGWMDEVFLYNRVLDGDEIRSLQGSRPFTRGKEPYSTDQLTLLVPGDGSVRDRSGYRRHGDVTGGASVREQLGKDGAFAFSGTSDKPNTLRFPAEGVFDNSGRYTLSFWFRRRKEVDSDGPGAGNVLASYGTREGNEALRIASTGSGLEVELNNDQGTNTVSWEGPLRNGRWYHLAFTYDRNRDHEAWLYLDGENVARWTAPGADIHLKGGPGILAIGNSVKRKAPFAGWLDELLVYGRALDAPELRETMGYRPHSRENLLLLARGNGEATDQSEYRRNVEMTEGASVSSGAGIGGAFSFNGKQGNKKNAVNFGPIEPLQEADSFSVAFWFRRKNDRNGTTNHGTGNVLFSQGADSANDNFEIGTSGSNIDVFLQTQTKNGKESYDAGIQNGEWYHLTLTYDADREKPAWLYLDGEAVKKWSGWKQQLVRATSPVTIGNTFHAETPFQGMMDEVYVYGRALHADEIQTIMEHQ